MVFSSLIRMGLSRRSTTMTCRRSTKAWKLLNRHQSSSQLPRWIKHKRRHWNADGANTRSISRNVTQIQLSCQIEELFSCMIIDMRGPLQMGSGPLAEVGDVEGLVSEALSHP